MEIAMILLIALGTFVFMPDAPDTFELPKRIFSCALGVLLVLWPERRKVDCSLDGGCRVGAGRFVGALGLALLAWMVFRTVAEGAPVRTALPLVSFALPVLLFTAGATRCWPEGSLRRIAQAVFWLGAAEAALMLCQRFGLDFPRGVAASAGGYAPGRMIGTFGYHNQAAEFLCVSLGAGWLASVTGSGRKHWRLMAEVASAAIAATILITANRGAVLGLLVLGICMAAERLCGSRGTGGAGRGIAIAGGCLLAVVAFLSLAPDVRGRIVEVVNAPLSTPAAKTRITMWRAAVHLFFEHPLIGSGAGDYAYRYMDLLAETAPANFDHEWLQSAVWAREAHCDPLQFLAEFGLTGVLFLAAFAFFAAKNFLAAGRMAIPACATVAAMTACSLFSFSWQTSLAAPVAAMLVGAAASGAPSTCSRSAIERFAMKPLLVCVSLMFLGVATFENCGNILATQEDFLRCGENSVFFCGRWEARAASEALAAGDAASAAVWADEAGRNWASPELALVKGISLASLGDATAAQICFEHLAATGLVHDEALKQLSLCCETQGDSDGALAAESERFRLFAHSFFDDELYRLVVMYLMAGDAAMAEQLAHDFFERSEKTRVECGVAPEDWGKITAEWENLYGSALLAQGRIAEAKASFKRALKKDPLLQSARCNLDAIR